MSYNINDIVRYEDSSKDRLKLPYRRYVVIEVDGDNCTLYPYKMFDKRGVNPFKDRDVTAEDVNMSDLLPAPK